MKIPSGTVYQQEESGEVLVLDVHHVFETYDLEAQTGQIGTRVLRHTNEWDGTALCHQVYARRPSMDFGTGLLSDPDGRIHQPGRGEWGPDVDER